MNFTSKQNWTLASASPRRKELLSKLNMPFTILTANIDESEQANETVVDYVKRVSMLKARAVKQLRPQDVIIGADTIVHFEGELLHKPTCADEALQHLKKLSGQTHEVVTAVSVITADYEEKSLIATTKVTFKKVDESFLKAYIATKDPFDKAGGYGIQTDGIFLVDKIEGDYNNVVGFPLSAFVHFAIQENLLMLQ